MSKECLSIGEACTKLKAIDVTPTSSTELVTKEQCLIMGAKSEPLQKYVSDFECPADDDVSNGQYVLEIPFASDFLSVGGLAPYVSSIYLYQESGYITFPQGATSSYLKYDIGNVLSSASKVTVTLDVKLNAYNLRSGNTKAPIFYFVGDALHTNPMNIWMEWVTWQIEDRDVIYICGIPEDPLGKDPYKLYDKGIWHTLKFVWNYTTQTICAYIDGASLSIRWPCVSRTYTKRPTQIQFGWHESEPRTYCSIKNFRMIVE